MAIRYDRKLNNEINRVIRNYNSKINRLDKSFKNLILPNKINRAELLKNVTTRSQLKRKLNTLKRYSIRGMEETITTQSGLVMSKYQLTNIKKESARVKRNVTREIKRLETTTPKVFGKAQVTTFARMGDTYYINLQYRKKALSKDITKLSYDELSSYIKLVEKTSTNKEYYDQVFKNNYLQMLTDTGYFYGYNPQKLDALKQRIGKLDQGNFLKLFRNEKAIQAILDYYPDKKGNFIFNPDDVSSDVANLYDTLLDNIDDILVDYK